MSKQLTMKAGGMAIFAALALVVALTVFAISAYQPVAAQETSNNVTRSFSVDGESVTGVDTGGTLDVTIAFAASLDVVTVTETLPEGWTYQSVMPDGVELTQNGQDITFEVLGGEDVIYTVMAPAVGAGESMSYTFSGTVMEQDGAMVGGDSMITVMGEAPPEPTPEPTPTMAPAPAPVLGLSLESGINMLAATWSHSQGADNYTVQWRAAADSDWSDGATTTDNFYDITGLTGGTTYWVRVRPNMEGAAASRFTAVRGTPDAPAPKPDPAPVLASGVTLSSYKADTAVRIVVGATADSVIRGGNDIVISMVGFQFPDGGIDEDEVIVQGAGSSFYGNPQDISVSGSNITITIPTKVIGAGGAAVDTQLDAGVYQVTFKQNAGLKTPNSSGSKTITVSDGDADADEFTVAITPHIAVQLPGWFSRGTDVTVTGKGINSAGTATVHLYSSTGKAVGKESGAALAELQVLGRATMDGGTAEVTIDTSSSNLVANAIDATKDASAKGINRIVMVDAGGNVIGNALLGLLPTVKLDVSEVRRSGKMEITVSDWYYGDVDRVEVNGILADLPDNTIKPNDAGSAADPWPDDYDEEVSNNKATFVVYVDRTVRLGEMEVAVYGKTSNKQGTAGTQDVNKQTVDVGVFDLTVNPSTAVSDQVIRIEGTGFIGNACIESIMVGEQSIEEATSRDPIGAVSQCVDTDSNGKLADTFRVPLGLNPGTYTLVVSDVGNRVGEAELVIPKPAIELEPAMGQRGETVTVIGSNFPADDLVTIRYIYGSRSIPVESVITDTVGKWRGTFTVPITAPIGATHEVEAKSVNKGDGTEVDGVQRATLSAVAEHEVPDETLTLTPETVAAGQRLTVVGGNLPLFTPVSVHIGGIAAAGRAIGDDDASDGTGRYEKVILVPQLQPGTHTVELTAHARNEDISVSRFVEIAPIVTRPTDEVFADLIEAGQLVSVWRYSIDATGSDWDSFDPQFVDQPGINDLELVSTDDIVWIRVTETVTFQGSPLYAGWNLRTLE